MNVEQLETRLNTLEAQNKELQKRLTIVEDIEAIKELQRTYGYYLDNHMIDDAVNLFSDNTEYVEATDLGIFLGKEGVRKFFKEGSQKPLEIALKSGLSIHLQLQGVVNLDPGGKTAHGRWQLLGILALQTPQNENRALWSGGIYENEYVKEDGKWKFKKLILHPYFVTTFEDGWAKLPYINFYSKEGQPEPDIPATQDKTYPTGYVLPLHFKNPVSGK
jgi:hypothetical protein